MKNRKAIEKPLFIYNIFSIARQGRKRKRAQEKEKTSPACIKAEVEYKIKRQ
jgi:hypothetical protein